MKGRGHSLGRRPAGGRGGRLPSCTAGWRDWHSGSLGQTTASPQGHSATPLALQRGLLCGLGVSSLRSWLPAARCLTPRVAGSDLLSWSRRVTLPLGFRRRGPSLCTCSTLLDLLAFLLFLGATVFIPAVHSSQEVLEGRAAWLGPTSLCPAQGLARRHSLGAAWVGGGCLAPRSDLPGVL